MLKFFVNFICFFIPFSKKRDKVRQQMLKNMYKFKTVLGYAKLNGFKYIKKGQELIHLKNDKIQCYINYPWTFYEIFIEKQYRFHEELKNKYIVFDIGANCGYSPLYFASDDFCEHVYAYELIKDNIDFMKKNISLNEKNIQEKITICPYGLGKKEEYVQSIYVKNRPALSSANSEFLNSKYINQQGQDIVEQRKSLIKKASTELWNVINKFDNIDFVIKIDTEGAEYDIFDDILKSEFNIFKNIVKIIGETHLYGLDGFDRIIKPISMLYKVTYLSLEGDNVLFEIHKK